MEVHQCNICGPEDLPCCRDAALPHDVCSAVEKVLTDSLVALLSC